VVLSATDQRKKMPQAGIKQLQTSFPGMLRGVLWPADWLVCFILPAPGQ